MLTIRISKESEEVIAFLRLHDVKYTTKLWEAIERELKSQCSEFKRKEKRIKDAPSWLYE